MRREMKMVRRVLLIAVLSITLFSFFGAGPALSAAIDNDGGELCLTSKETDVTLRLSLSDNGFVAGDFCIDGCGCGTILGESHIGDVDGARYGTIEIYADLAEECAYGLWYSIDMPSLSHIWYYTGLTSTKYSGTGEFKEISCTNTW